MAEGKQEFDIASELGRTGLKEYSGYIYEEETKQLKSYAIRHRTYKQMQDDAVIGAVLFAIEMFIRRAEWRVQEASDSPEDIEAKEFLESIIDDMSDSWKDTIAEITRGMLGHGFAFSEIVYKYRNGNSKEPSKRSKYDDGKIGWRKLSIRDQESLLKWDFDDEGGLNGMVQLPPPNYNRCYIPIEKALLFRPGVSKGNPEGIALLRRAYIVWYRKTRIETIEAIGIERDLGGYPVFYVPPNWADANATAGEKASYDDIKKMAVNVKRDEQEGMVLPSLYDDAGNKILTFELLTSGGKRNFDTNQIVQRYDQRIAMTMLAQFLLLGSSKVGSFALASSHTELFANAIGVILDSIASVLNRHGVPRLFELNGKSLENLPKFVPGDLESPDLAELGEYVNKLTGAGIDLSDHELNNYLREAAGLPLKAEEDPDEGNELEVKAKEAEKEETLVDAVKEMKETVAKAVSS